MCWSVRQYCRVGQWVGSPSYRVGSWIGSPRSSSWSIGQMTKAIALVKGSGRQAIAWGGGPSYRTVTSVREAGHQDYRLGRSVGVSLFLSLVDGSDHGITTVRANSRRSPIKEMRLFGVGTLGRTNKFGSEEKFLVGSASGVGRGWVGTVRQSMWETWR